MRFQVRVVAVYIPAYTDIPEEAKKISINAFRYNMKPCFSSDAINQIELAFSQAVGWKKNNVSVENVDNTKNHNKKDNQSSSNMISDYAQKSYNKKSPFSLGHVTKSKSSINMPESSEQLSAIKETDDYHNMESGSIFYFGSFEGNPIRWKVLCKDNGSIYAITYKIIFSRFFSRSSNDWTNSEIRKWLNGDFYNSSFNADEKNNILTVNSDKITLLSKEEAKNLMTEEERKGKPTGIFKNGSWWWLRSSYSDNSVCCVQADGLISHYYAYGVGGVRPALYIKYKALTRDEEIR